MPMCTTDHSVLPTIAHPMNRRNGMPTVPASTGTMACTTATNRDPTIASPPRGRARTSSACSHRSSPIHRPIRLRRNGTPAYRPMAYPADSPISAPASVAPTSTTNPGTPVTLAPATSTTGSPGANSPMNAVVSSAMNSSTTPATSSGGRSDRDASRSSENEAMRRFSRVGCRPGTDERRYRDGPRGGPGSAPEGT
jgi:hypothetical protein